MRLFHQLLDSVLESPQDEHLIWLLTSQLIHVPTGEIVLDDSTELKGDPEPMVRAGARILAERVARTIRERGSQRAARP
jgi:hypothetical protein